jgi:hypothetical protein
MPAVTDHTMMVAEVNRFVAERKMGVSELYGWNPVTVMVLVNAASLSEKVSRLPKTRDIWISPMTL